MWLVKASRPRRIVELGSHYGFSYFAFCQAVLEAGITTECFSIDTWQGDDHAGFYGEDVYQAVQKENFAYKTFSTLIRKTFKNALEDIEDGSVDLLHIDGRHSYEDVKEDFESWQPKLSDQAIVLFHDTVVKERDFGVWKLWSEIEGTRPSFNFSHQNGLGVLFWGSDILEGLKPFISLLEVEAGHRLIVDAFECSAGLLVDGASDQTKTTGPSTIRSRGSTNSEWIERLKKELQEARSKPARLILQKLQYHAAHFASSVTSTLSPRNSERFSKSASKRDPLRDDVLKDRLAASDYNALLEGWLSLRLEKQVSSKASTKFSLFVDANEAEPEFLEAMLRSARGQSHVQWELFITCSSKTRDVVNIHAEQDTRIKPVHNATNLGVTGASVTNQITGTYLLFPGAEDELDVDALAEIARSIESHPTAKIIYSDEDQIDSAGQRYDPHFKPDWNPDLFYSWNYVGTPVAVATELYEKVKRSGEKALDLYELILKASEVVGKDDILHITKVLYHVRESDQSREKEHTDIVQAGRISSLRAHLERSYGRKIPVEKGELEGSFHVMWPLEQEPTVTIIMPTRDNTHVLRTAVETMLDKTQYNQFKLVIVNNGSVEKSSLDYLKEAKNLDPRIQVLDDPRPFNYSALNNSAIAQSESEVLLFLNDDIEITEAGWLTELVSLAMRPDVGCVGAKLHYPDGLIQHAGIIVGINGVAGHSHMSYGREASGYFGRLKQRQNYSALTGACLAMRREVFDQVGGFNETELAVAFSDVDLCLKVQEAGYCNVWTPFAQLIHHESVSRGIEQGGSKRRRFRKEINYMQKRWGVLAYQDPAYNPNLTRSATDFSFAPPQWD